MKGFAKRMMLILTVGCLLCLLLSGCMSDKYENSEYVGVWKATTGSMGGINVNVAKTVGGEFTLDLQPNGDVKAVSAMKRATATGRRRRMASRSRIRPVRWSS